ncbi:MAG: hypothetical protein WED07_01850 [Candidatus Freyarchaeum deiterrae]
MSVVNGVLGGPWIYSTSWDYLGSGDATLNSLAVVGTNTATISGNLPSVNVYLHDHANLNTQNNTIASLINTYGSSQLSAKNTTFLNTIDIYDFSKFSATNTATSIIYLHNQCSASLSNITGVIFSVYDSAMLTCTGNTSAPSTINSVIGISNYPNMANVIIQNCTVNTIMGETWIPQAAGINLTPWLLYYSSSQGQSSVSTLLLAGGAIAVVMVAVAAVVLLRHRA